MGSDASSYKSLSFDWGVISFLSVLLFSVEVQFAFNKLFGVALFSWTVIMCSFQSGSILWVASRILHCFSQFSLIPVKATWFQSFLPLNISLDNLRQFCLARDQGAPCEKMLEMSKKSPRRSTNTVVLHTVMHVCMKGLLEFCALLFVPRSRTPSSSLCPYRCVPCIKLYVLCVSSWTPQPVLHLRVEGQA